jgi:glutamate carboxypeptidase
VRHVAGAGLGGIARHVTDRGADASALRPLAALVEPLERLDDPAAGTQVRVGALRAGTARQVVPGHGELLVDLRAETTAAAEAAVRRLVDGVERPPDVQLHVEGGVTRPAWPRGPGSLRLLQIAREAAAPLGIELGEVVERGGSDASFPGALGVPTLDGLGPIRPDSCSRDERVEVASLAPRGAILATVAARATRPA